MTPVHLEALRAHLNAITGPGGPFPVTGGIVWYTIDPRLSNLKERIAWAKTHQVGVLWWAGTRRYTRRGREVDAEAIIKGAVYWTAIEAFAHEGEWLLLEDAIHYALNTFASSGVDHVWLEGAEAMSLAADDYGEVLGTELTIAMRYHLVVPEPDYITIREAIITLKHVPIGGEG